MSQPMNQGTTTKKRKVYKYNKEQKAAYYQEKKAIRQLVLKNRLELKLKRLQSARKRLATLAARGKWEVLTPEDKAPGQYVKLLEATAGLQDYMTYSDFLTLE
jgi:hypothetical protein